MFRVVWQKDMNSMGAMDSIHLMTDPLPSPKPSIFSDLSIQGQAEPIFSRPPLALRSLLMSMPVSFREDPAHDLASYFHVFLENNEDAVILMNRLKNEKGIAYVDVQGRLDVPFIIDKKRRERAAKYERMIIPLDLFPTPTGKHDDKQVYLNDSPQGIGARSAWVRPGGKGEGVTIIDIEWGWNFEHEDLIQKKLGVLDGYNNNSDHGTAVLGIYSGDHNSVGIKGIAPNAFAGSISVTYDQHRRKWNAADAIRKAADRLKSGDIILLEMHGPGPRSSNDYNSQRGFVPVEYWQPEFAAIQYAVYKGINVVEAAGNGGENLDEMVYRGIFSKEIKDSGAVMVGGGSSAMQPDPRSRIYWSNFGSRLDVQGWGEDIVTTGGRQDECYYDLVDQPEASRCYTSSFGGTSGASPIVVGAIAIINGCLMAANRLPLSPLQMRDLLVKTGTPQTNGQDGPETQRIGPLPDLHQALHALNL